MRIPTCESISQAPASRRRRLAWFVGLAAVSLLAWGAAAFVFRTVIFFVLAH